MVTVAILYSKCKYWPISIKFVTMTHTTISKVEAVTIIQDECRHLEFHIINCCLVENCPIVHRDTAEGDIENLKQEAHLKFNTPPSFDIEKMQVS